MEQIAAIFGIISGLFLSIDVIGDKRVKKIEIFLESVTRNTEKFFRHLVMVFIGKEDPPKPYSLRPKNPTSSQLRRHGISRLIGSMFGLVFVFGASPFIWYLWVNEGRHKLIPILFGLNWKEFTVKYSFLVDYSYYIILICFLMFNIILFATINWSTNKGKGKSKNIVLFYSKEFVGNAAFVILMLSYLAIILFVGRTIIITISIVVVLWLALLLGKIIFDIKRKYELGNVFKLIGTLLFITSSALLILSWRLIR